MSRRFLILCLFSFLYGSVFSQQGSNPFEVRPVEINETNDSTFKQSNIFEVRETKGINNQNQETTQLNSDINPFDVSHIPLRKERKKKRRNLNKSQENQDKGQFVFWILLFSSIVFAILFSQNRSNIEKIAKGVLNDNILKQSMRTESNGGSLLYFLMYTFFAIQLAVFLYLWTAEKSTIQGIRFWGILFAGIAGVYFVRHIIMFLLGYIFPIGKETSQFSFTIGSFNIVLGIFLLPINLFIAFGPDVLGKALIYSVFVVILLLYLFRLLRGSLIFSRYLSSNLFHFFVYLCACEMAPVLILYRFIIG